MNQINILQRKLGDNLGNLQFKYAGRSIKEVRLEDYDVLLSLEMKICRLESEKLVEEGQVPESAKYIGVIGKPQGENERLFFDSKESASAWSGESFLRWILL
jgi:hypothetical protein